MNEVVVHMEVSLTLARNLRSARRRAGFTLQEVADACGVASRATVSRWESEQDQRVPEPSILVQLARLYGVSLDYLFGLEYAEELNPELRAVQSAVHEQLVRQRILPALSPTERIRRILAVAENTAPHGLPSTRIRKCLGPAYAAIIDGRDDVAIPVDGLSDFAYLVGLPTRALLDTK